MPVITKTSHKPCSATKLRPITTPELKIMNKNLDDPALQHYEFYDLEDAIEYPFRDQDHVWVRTKEDNWCYGRITGKSIRVGQTRYKKHGFFYPVNFGVKFNVRKYFAPLNGEIKPNTPAVRELLREGGWLNDEDADDGDIEIVTDNEYADTDDSDTLFSFNSD